MKKLYKIKQGLIIEEDNRFWLLHEEWDAFVNDDNLYQKVSSFIEKHEPNASADSLSAIVSPIGSQEVWGAGVTYIRSREARKEESQDAGGGDFYQRVYEADRPEIFFKNTAHRVAGPNEPVRIRRDSAWNVPEPELALLISSSGKILGYTVGNDMSSRDIEGDNPLYLPQAKTYDRSAALGPCVLVSLNPLPDETTIALEIVRSGEKVFNGLTNLGQINRPLTDLVDYLFRETSFPSGCFLMTGTGIIPEVEFTLMSGDEIRISIDQIGTLINYVE